MKSSIHNLECVCTYVFAIMLGQNCVHNELVGIHSVFLKFMWIAISHLQMVQKDLYDLTLLRKIINQPISLQVIVILSYPIDITT